MLISPPPWERVGDHEDHDDPPHRHPPRGVESHEVGAAARRRPEVVPAPSALVGGVDLVFAVRTGDVVGVGDPSIQTLAARALLRVRHELSSSSE